MLRIARTLPISIGGSLGEARMLVPDDRHPGFSFS